MLDRSLKSIWTCDDQSKYFSTHCDCGVCLMRAIVLRACRKWISFRVAGTCRRSSPPDSWGWTGQEHEQRSGSHPSSPPPGLPTTFPPPATFPPSFSQLTSTIQASSEARQLLKKGAGQMSSINCSVSFSTPDYSAG